MFNLNIRHTHMHIKCLITTQLKQLIKVCIRTELSKILNQVTDIKNEVIFKNSLKLTGKCKHTFIKKN